MNQHAWISTTLVLGAVMVLIAAAHDAGRPRLAPAVWVLAVLFVASIFPVVSS